MFGPRTTGPTVRLTSPHEKPGFSVRLERSADSHSVVGPTDFPRARLSRSIGQPACVQIALPVSGPQPFAAGRFGFCQFFSSPKIIRPGSEPDVSEKDRECFRARQCTLPADRAESGVGLGPLTLIATQNRPILGSGG